MKLRLNFAHKTSGPLEKVRHSITDQRSLTEDLKPWRSKVEENDKFAKLQSSFRSDMNFKKKPTYVQAIPYIVILSVAILNIANIFLYLFLLLWNGHVSSTYGISFIIVQWWMFCDYISSFTKISVFLLSQTCFASNLSVKQKDKKVVTKKFHTNKQIYLTKYRSCQNNDDAEITF